MSKVACYIILAQEKATGEILGWVEQSISMGVDKNFVRVSRDYEYKYGAEKRGITPRANAYQRSVEEVNELNKKYGHKYTYKVFRVGSNHCPVRIDWSDLVYRRKHQIRVTNSVWRNLPFKLKEDVTF